MIGPVIAHGAFTLAMFGLMFTVQLVIYPQFRSVPIDHLASYANAHNRRIVSALAPLAPFEILFAAWVFLDPPPGLSQTAAFVSGALLALGWLATALWFGPLHGRLQRTPNPEPLIDQLIRTNWARTGLWFTRAGFAVWFLAQSLQPA